MERTFFMIKPDGVKRKLIGEIIKRVEKAGLRIVAMKMVRASRRLAEKHYPKTKSQLVGMGKKTIQASLESGNFDQLKKIFRTQDPEKIGLTLRRWMIEFLISGPVVAMVVEGKNAVKKIREISGFTDPSKAKKGTIRGDLGRDSIIKANRERRAVKNLVHASGSKAEAEREIKLWFRKSEIFKI